MFDAIVQWPNLCLAWEENLRRLQELVRSGRYRTGGLRRVATPKRDGGERLLSIPNVGDRVVQRAVLNVLEPRLDAHFLPCSYGYRPGRGLRQAVHEILRLRDARQTWVVDADIDDCFDSLDHELLARMVARAIDDRRVTRLLGQWLAVGRRRQHPDRGIAQGMPISPLLCNLYLHEMDWQLVRARWSLVRYADDFVVCCATEQEAAQALDAIARVLASLKLRLEPRKTRITTFERGFAFLGVHFEGGEYSFTWQDKRIAVTGDAPAWLWSYAPQGYP